MALSRVEIRNLRVIREAVLEPVEGVNLVIGRNGAGKTSLLEAIYLLGRGRSFRASTVSPVVREGEECVEVVGTARQPRRIVAGIRRCTKRTDIRINGETVHRMSELARLFPVQIISPRSHELLERGPEYRRRFLDWGLFHVEPQYLSLLSRYQRTLRQRNEALKNPRHSFGDEWDEQLASHGEPIQTMRASYVRSLHRATMSVLEALGRDLEISFTLYQGWPAGSSLRECLKARREADRGQQHTTAGPHRCDLRVKVGDQHAERRLSRGQQKILVFAMIVAQLRLVAKDRQDQPILLVDDLPAELDEASRAAVLQYLEDVGAQVFVTSLDEGVAKNCAEPAMFHVEHGHLTRADTF